MNIKGQAIVETVIILPLILLITTFIISLFFYSFSYFFLNYQIHEAAFCQLSYTQSHCRKILENNLRLVAFIPVNSITFEETKLKFMVKLKVKLPININLLNTTKSSIEVSKEAQKTKWQ
ncbi:MAG: pilus assembly protein [Bdellovibrionaceae bacterium]|nr:pilus assembly protein [Pseudobdellovibrionaceae bacterium]NUM58836.1 pilus assembly protein [Pseudobdellovibrionaceae bacterium]